MLHLKRAAALFLTLALLLSLTPGAALSVVPPDGENVPGPAGLIWDSWDVIEEHLREEPQSEFSTYSVLPPRIDLTPWFPTPGNQGSQLSCTPWSVAYALRSHQEEVRRNWGLDRPEHIFSPGYLYSQVNDGRNIGSSFHNVMGLVVEQGVCTLASFPYDENDFTTQPTDEQRLEAAQYRVAEWYNVRGIDSIKRRLADGDGVAVGVLVYPDFDRIAPSNPIYDTVYGDSRGGHAICLIGYDDEKGAFLFINSWGTGWGLGGYGWISYELMEDTRVNHHGSAVGYVMDMRPDSILTEDVFDYTVSNGEAAIVGYFGMGGSVTVPETLGGYPVTAIESRAFQNKQSLTGVTIHDCITKIGRLAFSNCISLASVTIGRGAAVIEDNAFQGSPVENLTVNLLHLGTAFTSMVKLKNVTIGENVTSIASGMFSGCTSLTDITVAQGNPSYISDGGVLYDKAKTTLIRYPNSKPDTMYVVPDSVTSINNGALANCELLTEITASETHPDYASEAGVLFSKDKTTLLQYPAGKQDSEYTIPDGVTAISDGAFAGCNNLVIVCKKDSVGHSYAKINKIPFRLSDGMAGDYYDYIISDGRVVIIKCFADGIVEIPAAIEGYPVTSVDPNAFKDVANTVRSISLPESITSIAFMAFSGLGNNVVIYVPNNDIKRLVELSGVLSSRILYTSTGSGNCGIGVTWRLDTQGTLTIAGFGSMSYSTGFAPWYPHRSNVKGVTIERGVDSVVYGAFYGLPENVKINVSTLAAKAAVVGSGFPADRVIVATVSGMCGNDVRWVLEDDGTLTISGTGDMTDRYSANWGGHNNSIRKVVIEHDVTSIGSSVFESLYNLTEVSIPSSVTRIGNYAFGYCRRLETIVVPEGVTTIDGNAFRECSALTKVWLPESIESVGYYIFSGLPKNAKVYVPNEEIRERLANSFMPVERIIILIESGVCGDDLTWDFDSYGTLTISGTGDMWDFPSFDAPWYPYRFAMRKIELEDGVTSIGEGAFDGCRIETLITSLPVIDKTFAGMSALKTVIIKNRLTSIALGAFDGLHDEAVVYLPDHHTKAMVIDSGFPEESIRWLIIDSGYCYDDTTWTLDSQFTLTISGEGVLMTGYFAPWHEHLLKIKRVVIEDGITTIWNSTFSYHSSLTDVFIPRSVTTLGMYVFYDCPDVTIHCYRNSAAHNYAIEYDLPFVLLYEPTLPGDINGDSVINAADSTMLRVYLANPNNPPTGFVIDNADLNGDGEIDETDLALLRKYLAATNPVPLGSDKPTTENAPLPAPIAYLDRSAEDAIRRSLVGSGGVGRTIHSN